MLHNYEKARARLAARRPRAARWGRVSCKARSWRRGTSTTYWPQRALALSAYLKGDPKPLIQQAGPHPEASAEAENGNAVYTAVECNDAPWPTNWRTWDRDNARLARMTPFRDLGQRVDEEPAVRLLAGAAAEAPRCADAAGAWRRS